MILLFNKSYHTSWISHDDGTIRDMINHDGARAHHGPFANPQSGCDGCPRPDEGTFPYGNAAAQNRARRDVDKIADHAVMVDLRTRVDNGVISHLRQCLDDGAVKDHVPRADAG